MWGAPDSVIVSAAKKSIQAAGRTGSGSVGLRGGTGGSFNFNLGFSKVVLYRPVLDYYLNNQDGEVGRFLRKRGRLIVALAKRQVGVDTGKLKASINMTHERVSRGQQIRIGSSLPYAHMHHEGTQPHIITPKEAGILRFSSGGRVIYTHRVDHPGTRPNRYLSDQLWVARI